jgi:sterol desaturase/sphingolipid hydroxylase (fatty acid hydroxylase superfamily)
MTTSAQFANYLFGAALLMFFALLFAEKWRPYARTSMAGLKRTFSTNASAFLVNNIIMNFLSVSSLLVVAENYAHHGLLSNLPDGAFKFVASFVLFDFAVYVWHVLGHKFELLWRLHKVHHSDKNFHVTTGLRFHVFDQLLEVLFKGACAALIGVGSGVVVICEVIRMFFVLFHHANITFPGEKLLSYVIITPSLHRVHHSTRRSEHDSNYGIVLAIWDRIFGTRKELTPKKIGLDLIEAENLVQLFSLAFITERRLLRFLNFLPRPRGET